METVLEDGSQLPHLWREVLPWARPRRLAEGEVLVDFGEPIDALFVVSGGSLVVTPDRRLKELEGRAILQPGELLGPRQLGRPEHAAFRVRALVEAAVLELSPAALRELVASDLELGARVLCEARDYLGALGETLALGRPQGRVVGVFGPRGGAGVTTVALTIAGQAAAKDDRVLVADLNPAFGDVASYCGLEPRANTGGLPTETIEEADLSRSVTPGDTFDVLAAPEDPSETCRRPPGWARGLLRAATASYDLVVLDLARELEDLTLDALEACDQVVVVVAGDFRGLVVGRRTLALLLRLGIERENIHLVVNRHRNAGGITRERIEGTLGASVQVIAEDAGRILRCENRGAAASLATNGVAPDLVDGLASRLPLPTGAAGSSSRPRVASRRKASLVHIGPEGEAPPALMAWTP